MAVVLLSKLPARRHVASPLFCCARPQSSSVFACNFISTSVALDKSLENDGLQPEWTSFVSLSAGRENVKLMFCAAAKDKRTRGCLVVL